MLAAVSNWAALFVQLTLKFGTRIPVKNEILRDRWLDYIIFHILAANRGESTLDAIVTRLAQVSWCGQRIGSSLSVPPLFRKSPPRSGYANSPALRGGRFRRVM